MNSPMKKALGTCLLLSLFLSHANAQTQTEEFPVMWDVSAFISYSDAISKDVRDYYRSIVTSYRALGVPLPTQVEFGRTVGIGASVNVSRVNSIWAGFAIGYSYSPAYSGYSDYSGTLRINGSITSLDLLLNLKIVFLRPGDFQVYAVISPGANYSVATITQALDFVSDPKKNVDRQWSESAWGPLMKTTLGTSVPMGQCTLSLSGGYFFSLTNVPKDKITKTTGFNTESGWDIGVSGFTLAISIGTTL